MGNFLKPAWRCAAIGTALLVCIANPLAAQQTRVLTLDASIQLALRQSFDALSLEQSLISSRMNLRAARASFTSNAELRLSSFPNFQQTERQTPLPGGGYAFDQDKFLDTQGSIFVNQPIPALDGTFSLVGSFQRFQQFGEFEQFVPGNGAPQVIIEKDPIDYAPQLRLQYRQPLFTLNKLKTGVKRAELDLENTVESYKRSQLDLIFNVTSGFYSMYRAQRQAEIDGERVEQSENSYRIARLKQQAGLLPEVEVLRLEVDLLNSQNTSERSRAALKEAEDNFKIAVGLPLEDSVRVVPDLTYTLVDISVEKATTEALQRRTELRSDEIAIERSRLTVKEVDTNREFRGELFLSYGIFNRRPELSDAFRNFSDDRVANFSFIFPLWDWGRNRSEVAAATANLENARLARDNRVDQIVKEVRVAVRNLSSAQQRVEITKRSEELAEKSYRINLLKFENGDLSSQDLALEQNRLTEARTNYLNAIIDYKQALADLQRKTLWDFERNAPVEFDVPENR